MATTMIEVRIDNGDFIKLRPLEEQGSQHSFIREQQQANLLGLERERASLVISGIGSATKKYK